MKTKFYLFLLLCVSFLGYAQNTVIGTYPGHDGGFENQSVGNIASGATGNAALSATGWTTTTTVSSNNRVIVSSSSARSGQRFAQFGPNGSNVNRSYYTPAAGNFISGTTYQIQFWYKSVTPPVFDTNGSNVSIHYNNASLAPLAPLPTTANTATINTGITAQTVWTKQTVTLAIPSGQTVANGVAGINFDLSSSGIYIVDLDDFVIYPSTLADNSAPNSPGAITATGAASGSANVSWGAASGGVDGGGYVVVRYQTSIEPSASDDPNPNGIYNLTNTIGAGVVRYIGSVNSFTDTGLSPGLDYFYKVYTVDKAFNYSAESVTASPVQALATTYYFKGTGLLTDLASWGQNTNGTGTAPTNFTDPSQVFEIRNTTAVSLDGVWTVGTTPANGTKVRLGNTDQAAITLTLNSGASIGPSGTGNFDVFAPTSGNQKLIYLNTTAISLGNILDPNFEVIYDGVTVSSATTREFGTISLINGANVTFTAGVTITNLSIASGATGTFSSTPTITNITVNGTLVAPNNNTTFIIIPSGGALTVNGTIRIPRLSGFVSSGLGTPNTSTTTGADIQFLGTENLTLGANSIVEYVRDAAGAQTVSARNDYKNLTLGGDAPKVLSGNTTVAGTLTLNNVTGLPTGANTLTLRGATMGTGLIDTGISGTLVYNGSAAQTISNLTANTANNLTIDNSAGVTIGANTTVNNDLTISSGSLTVLSGINLTVTNAIINNGTLTIQNNANLVQVNNVANTGSGNTIVNRNSNPLFRLDFTLWSSPVTGSQTLAQFSPLTSLNRFFTFDPIFAPNGRFNEVSSPTTTLFAAGTGYLIRMPNENVLAGYNGGTSTLTYNGVFTGTPNNGTITLGTTVPLLSDKFYAVGNPYPSTISANAFINGNATDGTLYFYRKKNAGTGTAYASYNLVGSTVTAAASGNGSSVPDGTIAVGQGFIVKTGATATTLSFTNTMRTANNNALFFKTKQVQKDLLWLNLTSITGVFSQALLGYVDGATLGVDNGIDGKYINDSEIALTSNINNEEYTIQGRPAFDVADVVALNFKTDIAGDYTIAIDRTDGLFASGQDIYLADSKTGTETNLKEGGYNFTAAKGVDNARFSLKYQKTLKIDASELNNNSVQVYKNNGTLYVSATGKSISNIKVYDVQGRLIAEQKNVKSNTATISNLKVDNQVLIVRVTGEDNSEVTKKVLN